MMMWRVCWELLVTPSNMQRVMQSLTPRRGSHVIWPSLQNTCLLRSWLRRHSAQTGAGWSRFLSQGPVCPLTRMRHNLWLQAAGPQWLVTRPRCRVVTSLSSHDAIQQYQAGARISWSDQPSCRPHSDQLIHVPCCMFRKYIQHPMILAPVSQIERARGQLSCSNYLEIIIKIQLRIFTRYTCSLHSSHHTTLRHISVCGHRVRCLC